MGSARSQRPGECSKGHSGECPHMIAQGVNAQGVSHTVTWSLCSVRNPEPLHPVSRSPRTHCSPSQSSPVSPRPISPREIWTARVQYHTQSCTHTHSCYLGAQATECCGRHQATAGSGQELRPVPRSELFTHNGWHPYLQRSHRHLLVDYVGSGCSLS